MKKFLPVSIIGLIVVALLIISGCNNPSTSTNTSNTGCSNNFPGLETEEFLKGIARYRQYQWNASNVRIRAELQTEPGYEDARACWYSIEQLKEFICEIEKNKPDSVGELGIRFYYATYPDTQRHVVLFHAGNFTRGAKVNVGMRHTLFMVPTFRDKEINVDFYSTVLPGPESRPVKNLNIKTLTNPDWDTYMKTQTRLLVLGGVYKTNASGENQGNMCPPTCPNPPSTISKADALYPDGVITKN